MILSPVSTKSGTWTTAPVSSVAGFVTFVTVSPAHGGLRLGDRQLHGGRELDARRLAVDLEHLHRARRGQVRELVGDVGVREPEVLERLRVHEVGLGPSSYRNWRFLTSVWTRANFSPARNVRSTTEPDSSAFSLVRTKGAALAGLDVLELDDPPDGAIDLDVHTVAELVRGDDIGHHPPPPPPRGAPGPRSGVRPGRVAW